MTLRAARYCLAGHMRPVGRRLESPVIQHNSCREVSAYRVRLQRVPRSPPIPWHSIINRVPRRRHIS